MVKPVRKIKRRIILPKLEMELDKGYLGKRDKKLIECLLSISFGLIKPVIEHSGP